MVESLEKCISRKKMENLEPNIHETQVPYLKCMRPDKVRHATLLSTGRRESCTPWHMWVLKGLIYFSNWC